MPGEYYVCVLCTEETGLSRDLIPDGVVTEKTADFSKGHSSVAPGVSPVGHVLNAKFLLDIRGIQLPVGMARRVCVCVCVCLHD